MTSCRSRLWDAGPGGAGEQALQTQTTVHMYDTGCHSAWLSNKSVLIHVPQYLRSVSKCCPSELEAGNAHVVLLVSIQVNGFHKHKMALTPHAQGGREIRGSH